MHQREHFDVAQVARPLGLEEQLHERAVLPLGRQAGEELVEVVEVEPGDLVQGGELIARQTGPGRRSAGRCAGSRSAVPSLPPGCRGTGRSHPWHGSRTPDSALRRRSRPDSSTSAIARFTDSVANWRNCSTRAGMNIGPTTLRSRAYGLARRSAPDWLGAGPVRGLRATVELSCPGAASVPRAGAESGVRPCSCSRPGPGRRDPEPAGRRSRCPAAAGRPRCGPPASKPCSDRSIGKVTRCLCVSRGHRWLALGVLAATARRVVVVRGYCASWGGSVVTAPRGLIARCTPRCSSRSLPATREPGSRRSRCPLQTSEPVEVCSGWS